MPKLSRATPKYRFHKSSGQATVWIDGTCHYLGPHGTKASLVEYDRLAAFRRHAETHYRKNGRPTGELVNFDQAIKPLLLLYGKELALDFGPRKLKTIRELMVHGFTDRLGNQRH